MVDKFKIMHYNIFTNKLEIRFIGGTIMKVLVISDDKYLIRKIELELFQKADVYTSSNGDAFDAVVVDCDSENSFDGKYVSKTVIKVSRNEKEDGTILLPSPLGFFKELLFESGEKKLLLLSEDDKCAVLGNKKIKLTSHEYALLKLLLSGGAEYTARDVISKEVWNGANDGLINIYIHYLREKLEKNGEKIIISSRKYGYKINERYVL